MRRGRESNLHDGSANFVQMLHRPVTHAPAHNVRKIQRIGLKKQDAANVSHVLLAIPAQLFARYQRSEKALVPALVERDVQGVSIRKIKTRTEELCGHELSAPALGGMNAPIEGELVRLARRALEVELPYLILEARDEKVREEGVIRALLAHPSVSFHGLLAECPPCRYKDSCHER